MIFQGTDHWRIKPGGRPAAWGGSGAARGNACVRRKRKDPSICVYTHTDPSARWRGENGCWTQKREGSERVEPWSWGVLCSRSVFILQRSKHLTHLSSRPVCPSVSLLNPLESGGRGGDSCSSLMKTHRSLKRKWGPGLKTRRQRPGLW